MFLIGCKWTPNGNHVYNVDFDFHPDDSEAITNWKTAAKNLISVVTGMETYFNWSYFTDIHGDVITISAYTADPNTDPIYENAFISYSAARDGMLSEYNITLNEVFLEVTTEEYDVLITSFESANTMFNG